MPTSCRPHGRRERAWHLLDSTQDVAEILAVVAVIAVIGVAVDDLIVGAIDRRVRSKRGLLGPA